MIYLAFFITLFLFSFITSPQDDKKLFLFMICVLILFLSLRFGQGTDYFNYKYLYIIFPDNYNKFFTRSYRYDVEPFFYLVSVFAKKSELGFQFVVIFCACLSFFFIYKTIIRSSKRKLLSLFILFSNYFFYYQNIIRQSVAMSIAIYAIVSFLIDSKVKKYLLLIIFAMMFHTSAFICLFVPILFRLRTDFICKPVIFFLLAIVCFLGRFAIPYIIRFLLAGRGGHYQAYLKTISKGNLLPCIVRLLFSFLCLHSYKDVSKDKTSFLWNLYKLYLFGTLLYLLCSSISVLSRMTDYFTFLEVILIPNMYGKRYKYIPAFFCMFIGLYGVLFVKDLNNAIYEDNYYANSIIEYPYVTVFNKKQITKEKQMDPNTKNELINTK